MQAPYSETIAKNMKFVFSQLPEKGRRLYAGIEAQKLQRGGQKYIADLLSCSSKTIRRGEKELADTNLLPETQGCATKAVVENVLWKNSPN
jgi:hypothetical protein